MKPENITVVSMRVYILHLTYPGSVHKTSFSRDAAAARELL
jgi:hypothetical protein